MMRRFKTLAVVLASSLCLCGLLTGCNEPVAEDEKQQSGPRPYNITNNFGQDASSELLVQWHNIDSIDTQKLQIVPAADDFSKAQTITVTGENFESSGLVGEFESRNIFRAYVDGLSPDTSYKYRMGDTGGWSDTFYHLTSSVNDADFSFTVVTDPQSGDHVDMRNALKAADAFDANHRFYVMGGDLVDEIAMKPEEIVSYTNVANEFNIKRPIAATQGNHDTYYDGSLNGTDNQYRFGEATVFNKFVTFPDNGWDDNADKANRSQSYYFYYNKVLIIMLNTMATGNNAGTPEPNHSKQAQWLKDLLEKDRAEKSSRYTIVVTHISPFSGRSTERWLTPGVRAAYCKIFSDYEVDIVFAGHDHLYGRSNAIKVGTNTALSAITYTPTPGGTYYSIVGSTGPKFYAQDAGFAAEQYFPVMTRTIDDITPGSFVNVKVTAEKIIVTAMRVDGNQLDKYEVEAK